MTTDRPYRSKMSFEAAMEDIERKSGTQFDPEISATFLKYRNTIADMARKRLGEGA
jgi:HD-GYP domain-containing protein (c-di-GMP phosphodiesterase class II)